MNRRKAILFGMLAPEDWPSGNEFDAPVGYDIRREALISYSNGMSANDAAKIAGISRTELYRLAAKCLDLDSEGTQLGHRALLKYVQWGNSRRNSADKLNAVKPVAGAFALLLELYPSIKDGILQLALHRPDADGKAVVFDTDFPTIFEKFINLCHKELIEHPQYPFNSNSKGEKALRRYVLGVRNEEKARCGEATEDYRRYYASLPHQDYLAYERAEIDGYSLDTSIKVTFPGRQPGQFFDIDVKRIWLLALIECSSGPCLGYALEFGDNYSTVGISRTLRNATLPWEKAKSDAPIVLFGWFWISFYGSCVGNSMRW